MGDPVRLGVVGCGEIAQIMHFPHLSSMDGVTVHAVADVSPKRRERIGDRYGVPNRYEAGSELIEDRRDELDGVVVCTPPQTHTALGLQALDADLSVLMEKPLALAPADANRLAERARRADATAMVGYMKRYDPAYQRFRELMADEETIRYVDAYDVDPMHPRVVETLYDIVPGSVPEDVAAESERTQTEQARRAVGTDDDFFSDNYLYHLSHICHDVNLLRDLFGDVTEILHARLGDDGAFATAELRHESGVTAHLTSGRTNREWFEEYVRVDTPEKMLRIDFPSAYRKNAPTEVAVKEGIGETETRTWVPTVEEPFKRELRTFVASIRGEAEIRTSFADAAKDVELVSDLFESVGPN